jgi:hypothetical protein
MIADKVNCLIRVQLYAIAQMHNLVDKKRCIVHYAHDRTLHASASACAPGGSFFGHILQ